MTTAKIETKVKIGTMDVDRFIEVVSAIAHLALEENSKPKDKYEGVIEDGDFDSVDGLMCQLLNFIND